MFAIMVDYFCYFDYVPSGVFIGVVLGLTLEYSYSDENTDEELDGCLEERNEDTSVVVNGLNLY
jgi:hypothetical protein